MPKNGKIPVRFGPSLEWSGPKVDGFHCGPSESVNRCTKVGRRTEPTDPDRSHIFDGNNFCYEHIQQKSVKMSKYLNHSDTSLYETQVCKHYMLVYNRIRVARLFLEGAVCCHFYLVLCNNLKFKTLNCDLSSRTVHRVAVSNSQTAYDPLNSTNRTAVWYTGH